MKIKPKGTYEEATEVSTVDGILSRIKRYSKYDALTSMVFKTADNMNLDEKDTMIFLAYQALIKAEGLFDELIKTKVHGIPPIIINAKGPLGENILLGGVTQP